LKEFAESKFKGLCRRKKNKMKIAAIFLNMKNQFLLLATITFLFSSLAGAEICTNTSKATLSWKQSCKARVLTDKIASGTEYKGDPCECGLGVFTNILKLADNKCDVSAEMTMAVFMNENFKDNCLDKK